MEPLQASYILPLKLSAACDAREIAAYANDLPVADIIVADGSEPGAFSSLDALLKPHVRHVRTSERFRGRNGKVRNVLTALQLARFDRIIVADDDVRYTKRSLAEVVAALDHAEVVRPQNYFHPLPWHAVLDTGRILINRALDGDWPGTLAFRRSSLPNGYSADVLFENYELVRTVRARGGRELVARDIFVARRPPTTRHFLSQRVRQAYDEFARPARLIASLAIAPTVLACAFAGMWIVPVAGVICVFGLAAFGWARDNGSQVLPAAAIVAAPVWVCERAVCAWLAVYERVRFGGVRYAGGILRDAATRGKDLNRWAA